jgi:hypothetical protein
MESMIKQMRDDYMKKMNSITTGGSFLGLPSLGIKDRVSIQNVNSNI